MISDRRGMGVKSLDAIGPPTALVLTRAIFFAASEISAEIAPTTEKPCFEIGRVL